MQFQWFTTAKTLESHNAFANPWQAEDFTEAEEVKKDTAAGRCFIQSRWPVAFFPAIAQDLLCLHLQELYSSFDDRSRDAVQISIIESFPGCFLLSIVVKLRPCKHWQQFVKRWDNGMWVGSASEGHQPVIGSTNRTSTQAVTMPKTAAMATRSIEIKDH